MAPSSDQSGIAAVIDASVCSVSVDVRVRAGANGVLVCESQQGLGVDVQAKAAAPSDEGVRLHMHFDGADAAFVDALMRLLSSGQPVVIGNAAADVLEQLAALEKRIEMIEVERAAELDALEKGAARLAESSRDFATHRAQVAELFRMYACGGKPNPLGESIAPESTGDLADPRESQFPDGSPE